MSYHLELVQTAKDAIQSVFSDTSVDKSVTRASLEDLYDEIETSIEAMDNNGEDAEDDEDSELDDTDCEDED